MSEERTITPNDPADFTPAMGNYKSLHPFRYWCQKVLPLVYDDSLSYYELLCKVVDYLNKTMEDVETLHVDVTSLHEAYVKLQSYVNNYFSTLDVQEEINNKLDQMAKDGTLADALSNYALRIFNNVADMKKGNNHVGDKVATINYYDNDRGGAFYLITNDTSDGYLNIPLDNGLCASLIWNGHDLKLSNVGGINNLNKLSFLTPINLICENVNINPSAITSLPYGSTLSYIKKSVLNNYRSEYSIFYSYDNDNNDAVKMLMSNHHSALILNNIHNIDNSQGSTKHWCSIFFADGFTDQGFADSYFQIQTSLDTFYKCDLRFYKCSDGRKDVGILALYDNMRAYFGETISPEIDYSFGNRGLRDNCTVAIKGTESAVLSLRNKSVIKNIYIDNNDLNVGGVIIKNKSIMADSFYNRGAYSIIDSPSEIIVNNNEIKYFICKNALTLSHTNFTLPNNEDYNAKQYELLCFTYNSSLSGQPILLT